MSEFKLGSRDKVTLGLMVLMSFFLQCDLYITPAIVPELAAEYGVPNASISYVASAFTLLGAALSIIFGYFSDKSARKQLLMAVVLIGEIPCFLTGIKFFTASFQGYVIMRILTGIGVGGIYPLLFSLVSDYFTDRHRAKAVAFIDIAWGLGTMVGPIMANIGLASGYGWRLAFILAAVPNFPVVLLFGLIARSPERGSSEKALAEALHSGAEYNHKIKLSDFRHVLKKRTNLFLFLQGIPGTIPWGILTFWVITFFRETQGMGQAEATLIWELFGVGVVTGGLFWAFIGDKLFSKKPSYLPLLCTIGIMAGTIPCFIFFNIPFSSPVIVMALSLLGGACIATASSNNKAMLMNVNRPEHRGSVFAVFNLTDNIGKGFGPAIGGAVLAATSSYGLMVNMAISFWFLCSLLFIGVIFSINKDRKEMLELMEERGRELKAELK